MELVKVWVSIPSRGFWFFEDCAIVRERNEQRFGQFQSPRGDFGFLKFATILPVAGWRRSVSIPSRGFWFFEVFGVGSLAPFPYQARSFNPLAGILVF